MRHAHMAPGILVVLLACATAAWPAPARETESAAPGGGRLRSTRVLAQKISDSGRGEVRLTGRYPFESSSAFRTRSVHRLTWMPSVTRPRPSVL